MHVKTTNVRYNLTLVRMAIIKTTTNNKCWWWCREKRALVCCWWECKLVQTLTVWRFLKKLKIEPIHDPAIPLLSIYLEKSKTLIKKDICTPMFTVGLLLNHKKQWKSPIYSDVTGPRKYDLIKTNIVWYHLHVGSKN